MISPSDDTVWARIRNEALEQASADLGANEWVTFRRITLPQILPGDPDHSRCQPDRLCPQTRGKQFRHHEPWNGSQSQRMGYGAQQDQDEQECKRSAQAEDEVQTDDGHGAGHEDRSEIPQRPAPQPVNQA